MDKKCHTSYIPYIEKTIKESPELSKQFQIKTDTHFKVGNYVECTYLKGIFKITHISNVHNTIKISYVDSPNRHFTVNKDFVRLYEGSSNAVKVLFEP